MNETKANNKQNKIFLFPTWIICQLFVSYLSTYSEGLPDWPIPIIYQIIVLLSSFEGRGHWYKTIIKQGANVDILSIKN